MHFLCRICLSDGIHALPAISNRRVDVHAVTAASAKASRHWLDAPRPNDIPFPLGLENALALVRVSRRELKQGGSLFFIQSFEIVKRCVPMIGEPTLYPASLVNYPASLLNYPNTPKKYSGPSILNTGRPFTCGAANLRLKEGNGCIVFVALCG